MNQISNLPFEILEKIINNINIADLFRCRLVNKTFENISQRRINPLLPIIQKLEPIFLQISDKYDLDHYMHHDIVIMKKLEIDKYVKNIPPCYDNDLLLISLLLWKKYPIPVLNFFDYDDYNKFTLLKPIFYALEQEVMGDQYEPISYYKSPDKVLIDVGWIFCVLNGKCCVYEYDTDMTFFDDRIDNLTYLSYIHNYNLKDQEKQYYNDIYIENKIRIEGDCYDFYYVKKEDIPDNLSEDILQKFTIQELIRNKNSKTIKERYDDFISQTDTSLWDSYDNQIHKILNRINLNNLYTKAYYVEDEDDYDHDEHFIIDEENCTIKLLKPYTK